MPVPCNGRWLARERRHPGHGGDGQRAVEGIAATAIAGWGKHRGDYIFAVDPRTGERYVRTSFDYDGSAGAVWGFDGYQAVSTLTAIGAAHRDNVEEMEVRVPWRALKWEMVPDFRRRRPLARRSRRALGSGQRGL